MTQEKLGEIVASHGKWLVDKATGERAYLSRANLYGADLHGADLTPHIVNVAPIRGGEV